MGAGARGGRGVGLVRAAVRAALWLGVLGLGHAGVQAQSATPAYWVTNCTTGCHTSPSRISTGPADTRVGTVTNVSTAVNPPAVPGDWLGTAAAFAAYLDGKRANAGAMGTLADSDAAALASPTSPINLVRTYLTQLRDGVVPESDIDFAGNTSIGSARTTSITLYNYRFVPLNFSVAVGNTSEFSVSGCGVDTANSDSTGSISGVADTVTTPQSCTLTIRFAPTAGTAVDRSSTLGISFSGNEGGNPRTRSMDVTGHVPPGVLQYTSAVTQISGRVGQDVDVQVGTLRNTGDATFSLTGIALVAPLPVGGNFSVLSTPVGSCTTTQTLGKNASCALYVRFRATQPTPPDSAATFRVSRSGSASTVDVPLTGRGLQPLISPTATTINYGNVQVGVTTPRTQDFSNTGSMNLTFLSPGATAAAALTGASKDDFSVASSCPTAPADTLAPGALCTLTISFRPPLLAPLGVERVAQLTVTTDADNNGGLLTVTLRGTPVALPEPIVSSPATNFPDTVIGAVSAETRTITVRNDRTRAVEFTFTEPADFKIGSRSNCGPSTTPHRVEGGQTCTLAMEFRPTLGAGEGARTATIPFALTGTSGDANPNPQNASLGGRALLPLQLSTGTLALNAEVGTPTSSVMLLTNRSAAALTLNTFAITGTNGSEFTVDGSGSNCANGRVLNAGANCSLVVRFAPLDPGSRTGTLTITHTALGSTQQVLLDGTATPRPQGRLELSGTSITFGDTQLNASAVQSLTLSNAGNLALNFSSFDLSGATGDYERSGSCSTAAPLAIGAQCTLTITFHPTQLGLRSANLSIVSDGSNPTPTIQLRGTGVPIPVPVVTFVPASLDFGDQTFGGLYPARTVRLSNTGTATLNVASVVVEGTGFSDVSTTACPAALAPNDGCDVLIRFTPPSAGASFTGALRVASNAAGSPHSAALSGTGVAQAVPVLVWSPAVTELVFDPISVGTISAVQTVTLLNQGPGGVEIKVLNAVGPDGAVFSVAGGTCAVGVTVFQGATCTVSVSFAPASAGARTASVQVASTGSFPPTLTLRGTGLGGPTPGLGLSQTTIAFEGTRAGAQSLPREITLTSSGSGAVQVTALTVTGPYTMQPKSCPNPPFALPAGSDCTVVVSFVPEGEGDAAGILRITSSAGAAPLEVALSGHGEAKADLSSGGCSLVDGDSATDPTLWTLVLLAATVLLWRRRNRAAAARRSGS